MLKPPRAEGPEIMVTAPVPQHKCSSLTRAWISLVLIPLPPMFFIWIKKVGWLEVELRVCNKNTPWDVTYAIIARSKRVLVWSKVFTSDEIRNTKSIRMLMVDIDMVHYRFALLLLNFIVCVENTFYHSLWINYMYWF